MNNKKAQGIAPETMVAFGIAFLLFLGLSYLAVTQIFGPGAEIAATIQLEDAACFSSGRQAQVFGTKFTDKDNDLRPDLICDSCLPGDNSLDRDLDKVPDECDYSPDDPKIGFCFVKNKWLRMKFVI